MSCKVRVNQNWAKNDNRPVKSPRYEMLMDFLELSRAKNDPFFHDYPTLSMAEWDYYQNHTYQRKSKLSG